MKRLIRAISVFVGALLCAVPAWAQSTVAGYHIIDSLRLGGDSGWDYLTVDTSTQRLYVSRGSRVQVIDIAHRAIVGEITHTPGVHGVALVPFERRGYTSNGQDSSVTVFDRLTLQMLETIRINARNPDAILFDPFSRRVFTFNGGSSNVTVISVKPGTIVGTVPLVGKPEFGVSDGQGHIYVNIEDKNMISVFDAVTLKTLHNWSLAPGEEPTGLAIDQKNRRLFAGCRNRLMVILDADSGRVVATVPIGGGVDGTAYDPATHLAFSANGEGTLTVVQEDTPEKFTLVGNVVTRRGARTLALDERTHQIFTVAAQYGLPKPTAEQRRSQPSIVPGSVTLYILGN